MTGLLDMIIGSTNSESLLAIANALELIAAETEKLAGYSYTQSQNIETLMQNVNLISVNLNNMFYWVIGLSVISVLSLAVSAILAYRANKLQGQIEELLKK